MKRYSKAKWKKTFADDTVGKPRVDDPDLEGISRLLRQLARKHPDRIKVETIGKSAGGNPIELAMVTDRSVPDSDKQIALFFAGEHGNEHSSVVSLLKTLQWLTTPESASIRRRQKVLIIPCVNPDGYDTMHMDNMNGVNLYLDYSLTQPPSQPESRAVWKTLERFRPEVVGSCHGHWRMVRTAAFENCQGSYGSSRYDRTHSRLFAEEVNKACDRAGYPQDRMEEDAERVLVAPAGFENHAPRSGEGITAGVYAYHRFHSMLFSMEIMHDQSGVIKLRKILELGNRPWRYERQAGYPVRVISSSDPFIVAAYGTSAEQRRKSRMELWQSNDTIMRFMLPHIEDTGFIGIGVTVLKKDWDFRCTYVSEVLDYFASDPNIQADALRRVLGKRLKSWWSIFSERPSKNPVWLNEIKHGLGIRLRLLPGSKVKRVLINGRPAPLSRNEGYELWTPRHHFQLLQINIPPGRSIAA
ncbi:MAG: hypothetical protein L6437_03075, partial [Kiritimatiellae bacterium]|nr:hypothetical protein [Kiritimatiellia bacterium]